MFSEPSSHLVANELSDEWSNGFGFAVDGTMAAAMHSLVVQLPFAVAFAWALTLVAVVDAVVVAADGRCCAVRIVVVAAGLVSAEALADSVRVRRKRLALAAAVVLHIV